LGKWIRHCGWWPDYQLRLFRRTAGNFPPRLVHEHVKISGKCGHLRGYLAHYTYKSLSEYFKRMEIYISLAGKQMEKDGKRGNWLNMISHSFFTFLRMYFWQAGFLEGPHGLILSILYSFYTFGKYAKLWELQKE